MTGGPIIVTETIATREAILIAIQKQLSHIIIKSDSHIANRAIWLILGSKSNI